MLLEKVCFLEKLPVKISLLEVDEYPLHYHQGILELIYVLTGEVDMKFSIYRKTFQAGDIMGINDNTLHYIKSLSEKSQILSFQFDLDQFIKYNPYAKEIIFIVSSGESSLGNYEYQSHIEALKEKLLDLAYTGLSKEPGYEEKTQKMFISCLLYLTNHFQYYHRENTEFKINNIFKDKGFQMQRIHRIISYIYKNYNRKITLDELAQTEYVSKFYMSHLIRYGFGESFQNTLNIIRVDESEKMLFGTKKSIDQIALESGFSSGTFYKNSYLKWTGISPGEQQKTYAGKTIDCIPPNCITFDDAHTLSILNQLFRNQVQPVYSYCSESPISTIQLDFSKNISKDIFTTAWKTLYISDVSTALSLNYLRHLEEFQKELHFSFINLNFSELESKYHFLKTWEYLGSLLEIMKRCSLKLLINYFEYSQRSESSLNKTLIKELTAYCSQILDPENVVIEITQRSNPDGSYSDAEFFNSSFMPCMLIHNALQHKGSEVAIPYLIDGSDGQAGLLTDNGLRKPAYYGYYFLNHLGNTLLSRGDSFIVTKNGDSHQILIYNYKLEYNSLICQNNTISSQHYTKKEPPLLNELEFIVHFSNIDSAYMIKKFSLNRDTGQESKLWEKLGCPKHLDNNIRSMIRQMAFPQITFSNLEIKTEHDIYLTLKPFEAVLIMLDRIS